MKVEDIDFVSALLKKRSGINVSRSKQYLFEARLAPLARREGFDGIDDLVSVARTRKDERLLVAIIEVMTTNETYFFRDRASFEHLKTSVLPDIARRKNGAPVRILCAGCSTGQEPYSIAMMVHAQPELLAGSVLEIIATDISRSVLTKARTGAYTQFEVQRGLPIGLLMENFTQSSDIWTIVPQIQSRVEFRQHNLMDPLDTLGEFDIILCRNVMIYFDIETKRDVLGRLTPAILPGGCLMLGAAETLVGLSSAFTTGKDHRGIFMKLPAAGAATRAA